MSYEPDREYEVEIDSVTFVESQQKKTPGLEFRLQRDPEGILFHNMWITEGTKERAWKTLLAIGVPAASLKSADFWTDPGEILNGKHVRITTEMQEYKDKKSVRVKWLNPLDAPRSLAGPEAAASVANLFSLFEDESEPVPF